METDHYYQSSSETIMASLLTLTPTQFSYLSHTLSSDFHIQTHRLYSLLSSPLRFAHTLQFLQTLSLHDKTLLIARYLQRTLKQLTNTWETETHASPNTGYSYSIRLRLREYDAVSLLLLLCEVYQYNSQFLQTYSLMEWHEILNDYVFNNTLMSISGMGFSCTSLVLCPYIDNVIKCKRFLDTMMSCSVGHNKPVVAAASALAVVSLRSVQVSNENNGVDPVSCVICKEEMKQGRDVCEMPCKHLFHWICILPWLKKRNTCPCCRYQMPTEDVFGEIDRLWGVLINKDCCRLRN
ncbi:E3 ubiquitin-protein ligase SGR9, amyloplastic-like [Papaver somniferum]|nr:E3 ubiquitin-protein ligase SGR9, amyloplastic-like [Papaver somniferum]